MIQKFAFPITVLLCALLLTGSTPDEGNPPCTHLPTFDKVKYDESDIDVHSNELYTDRGLDLMHDSPCDGADDDAHLMDIYQPPFSEDCPDHPLVMYIPGGGFANTVNRNFARPWAMALARAGYVVAVIGYRANTCRSFTDAPPECKCYQDAYTDPGNCDRCHRLQVTVGNGLNLATKNWYRATQDAYAALHFFEQWAVDKGIQPVKTFVIGQSAGAVTALHLALADQGEMQNVIPNEVNFLGNLHDYVDSSIPSPQILPEIDGTVSLAGAISDLDTYIDAQDDMDLLMFHGDCDRVVPICLDNCPAPATHIYGSAAIVERYDALSNPNANYWMYMFWDKHNGHNVHIRDVFMLTTTFQFFDQLINSGPLPTDVIGFKPTSNPPGLPTCQ